MSLNQIVKDDYKFWMDAYVNSIRITNDFTYEDSLKAAADNFVLDNDLIATWAPTNITTLSSSGIAVKVGADTINSDFNIPLSIQPYINYSPLYRVENDSIVLINPGTYIIFANVNIKNNLTAQYALRMELETTTTGTFSDIRGSDISFPPGMTLYSSNFGAQQSVNIGVTCFVAPLATNRRIRLLAGCFGGNSTINQDYSYITVLKVG